MKFLLDEKGVHYPGQDVIPWRPSQMVCFIESDNIRVQDIELVNSAYWTSWYLGCTHVFIRGVQIKTSRHPHAYNGDGIDIDCCEYVTVSDCHIDTADDCITLRGHNAKLKTKRPCRYVAITNCILSTPCNCFRVGVGDGKISDVVVDNIVIETSRTAFNFVSCWVEGGRGVDIHNVRINNVVVDCEVLLHMYYHYAKTTEMRNISISGISGKLRQVRDMDPARRDESCIWLNIETPHMVDMPGHPNHWLCDIRFSDIHLDVFPGAQWLASYVKGMSMENIRLRSTDPAKPAVYKFHDVTDLSKTNIQPAF